MQLQLEAKEAEMESLRIKDESKANGIRAFTEKEKTQKEILDQQKVEMDALCDWVENQTYRIKLLENLIAR